MTKPERPEEPPLVYDEESGMPRWIDCMIIMWMVFSLYFFIVFCIPWMTRTATPAVTLDSDQIQGVFNCPESSTPYSPELRYGTDTKVLHVQFECRYTGPIE